MKQQQKCSECRKTFWTGVIKVFVFKQYLCPADHKPLNISANGEEYICIECGKIYHKSIIAEFLSLGVSITGSSRDFTVAEKERTKGNVAVEKVFIAEHSMCKRCENYQIRYAQATAKREKKLALGLADDIQVIPNTVSDADIYRYEVMRKTQEDYKQIKQDELKVKQEKEEEERRKKIEAEQKLKLVQGIANELLNPEEVKPLIDPETRKLIEEAKRRDVEARSKKFGKEEKKDEA